MLRIWTEVIVSRVNLNFHQLPYAGGVDLFGPILSVCVIGKDDPQWPQITDAKGAAISAGCQDRCVRGHNLCRKNDTVSICRHQPNRRVCVRDFELCQYGGQRRTGELDHPFGPLRGRLETVLVKAVKIRKTERRDLVVAALQCQAGSRAVRTVCQARPRKKAKDAQTQHLCPESSLGLRIFQFVSPYVLHAALLQRAGVKKIVSLESPVSVDRHRWLIRRYVAYNMFCVGLKTQANERMCRYFGYA
jgi:hypothetical protein